MVMSEFTENHVVSSKGQTEEEIAAEVAKRKAELKSKSKPTGDEITVHNVGSLSAYDIRQELNRRDAFDFKDEDTVNFRTLLKRLMVELVKDEEKKAQTAEQENKVKIETEIEKSKRIREEKKRAAIERSKQRQADPNYFKKMAEKNVQPEKLDTPPTANTSEEEDVNDNTECSNDPFQSFTPKGRPKIYIR